MSRTERNSKFRKFYNFSLNSTRYTKIRCLNDFSVRCAKIYNFMLINQQAPACGFYKIYKIYDFANRTFEANISIKRLIQECFQRCLILAYANLWRKKNILPFYKLVATYKNCPKTTLILKRALGKITKVKFITLTSRFEGHFATLTSQNACWYGKVSGVTFGHHVSYSLSVCFLFLNFVHDDCDCVYRHTYEVFVLGTIRLLVSHHFVNFISTSLPLILISISFVFTPSIFVVAEASSYLSVCCILYWQPSLKAMETSLQRSLY